jgi:hypothetical protein
LLKSPRDGANKFASAKKVFRKSLNAFLAEFPPSVAPFEAANAVCPSPQLLTQLSSELVKTSLALKSVIDRTEIRVWNADVSEAVNQTYSDLFGAAEKLSERRISLLSTQLDAWIDSQSIPGLRILLPRIFKTRIALYLRVLELRSAVTHSQLHSPLSRTLRPAQLEMVEITLVYMIIILDHTLLGLSIPEETKSVWEAYEQMFSDMMKLRTMSTSRATAETRTHQRCQVLTEQIRVALRFFGFCQLFE